MSGKEHEPMFSVARIALALAFVVPPLLMSKALAESLTIYQVQYTTNPDGGSDHDGELIDCVGGIVVAKYAGFRPRIILQDPAYPDGWGGIQVKDWTVNDLFANVELGDWVELTNVLAEEFRGTTILQWQTPNNPGFLLVTEGNPLPPPRVVAVADVPAPIEHAGDEWYVVNHEAEPYESMRLIIRDVTVTQRDLGKAVDNYSLQNNPPSGDICWASDYMNEDAGVYHPFVEVGQHFCAVVGLFEQYTKLSDGWDYYQLLTKTSADLAICGDGDSDGDVDLDDVPRFVECLSGPLCNDAPGGCDPLAWTSAPAELPVQHCLMMDLDYDGDVDLHDFAGFLGVFGDAR